jgi:ABC-type multidrug transport system fused ATPase/permease subunit
METKDDKNSGLLRACIRIMREMKQYYFSFGLSVLLSIISTILGIAANIFLGQLTNTILNGGDFGDYRILSLLIMTIFLSFIFGSLTQYHWGALCQRVNHSLRKKTMMKIHNIGHIWFEAHTTGDIIVRLNDDLGQMIVLYTQIRAVSLSILSGFISLLVMIRINISLSIVSILFPIIMQWLIFHSSKKLDLQFQQQQELLSDISAYSEEILGAINEVKAMNFITVFCRKYTTKISQYIRKLIYLDRLSSKNDTILEALGYFQSLLFIIVGGFLIFLKSISIGNFLIARIMSENVNGTIGSLNFFYLRMQLASAKRIFEVWDAKEKIQIHTSPIKEFVSKNSILEFKNVSFYYPLRTDIFALTDISLSVSKGEKIAIVGPNGSGKSTLLKLIAGFYTPICGGILQRSDKNNYNIALVEQNTFLFSDTYYNNIACGNASKLLIKDLHLDKIVKCAARVACIDEHILATENRYQSMCISPGANLSGGQRQQMAIARCLCSEAEIILLDEPTSSLDHETKFFIMTQIEQAFKNKTVIFVTHDMTLVQNFDMIVVLDGGRIVEQGSHEELIKINGLYATLVKDVLA